MHRLILVSNRLPVTVAVRSDGPQIQQSSGGLATALREASLQSNGVWIGWPGPTAELPEPDRHELDARLQRRGIVPVHLSSEEVSRFYETFANGILWPLFHYVTGVLPLRVEGWTEYRAVNERFAEAVVAQHRPGDLIWVHDYHLMLVPGFVRRQLPDARIGFFLHIPFPSAELFASLPHGDELLQGLLGSDLLGFHTADYRRHFRTAVRQVLGLSMVRNRLVAARNRVRLGVFPINVDAAGFAARARTAEVTAEVEALRGDGAYRLLVGVDRLDYTKGIPRRLLAFEELLERRPEWRGRVRLIQVAVPSRTGVRAYRHFRKEVDSVVGRINGSYGTPHWTPVHYVFRGVPQRQLLALYRAADAMLVTPVRDGMNLVAKEFVATRADGDGVLVLSQFAGAAAELKEALLVNPYDIEATAEAYHKALTMPESERKSRMRALRERVFRHDVHDWTRSFLTALRSTGTAATPAFRARRPTPAST
jgi:trehalose 6-phosphate synthase/phosphatase